MIYLPIFYELVPWDTLSLYVSASRLQVLAINRIFRKWIIMLPSTPFYALLGKGYLMILHIVMHDNLKVTRSKLLQATPSVQVSKKTFDERLQSKTFDGDLHIDHVFVHILYLSIADAARWHIFYTEHVGIGERDGVMGLSDGVQRSFVR